MQVVYINISNAEGALLKFDSTPTEAHLTAAKRIIRYLKGAINVSIQYRKTENLEVIGYSDADWANDMEHRHSTTGVMYRGCIFSLFYVVCRVNLPLMLCVQIACLCKVLLCQ